MTTPLDCGVCCGALQLLSQLQMVVDFPIEYEDEASGVGNHWLVTGRRQIENGQTTVRQSDSCIQVHPHACVIRAS